MKTRLSIIVAAGGLVLASACTKQETVREIDWAKSALARNPAYEIVATDESTGVFTVRDTASGTIQTLRLEELIAAPAAPKVKPAPAVAAPRRRPNRWSPGSRRRESVPRRPKLPRQSNSNTPLRARRAEEGPWLPIARGDACRPRSAEHARRTRLFNRTRSVRKPAQNRWRQRRTTRRSHRLPGRPCASTARPSASPGTPSSRRKVATSNAFAQASQDHRAPGACTSSAAASAARAVRTKRRRAARSHGPIHPPGSGVLDSATVNDLGDNAYLTNQEFPGPSMTYCVGVRSMRPGVSV